MTRETKDELNETLFKAFRELNNIPIIYYVSDEQMKEDSIPPIKNPSDVQWDASKGKLPEVKDIK